MAATAGGESVRVDTASPGLDIWDGGREGHDPVAKDAIAHHNWMVSAEAALAWFLIRAGRFVRQPFTGPDDE